MSAISSQRIEIPLSKGKIAFLLMGSIAFVAIGVWMWMIADVPDRALPWFARSPWIVKGVAAVTMCFFGACCVFAAYKMLDGKPGLVIDGQGIIDNSSGVAAGRIAWNDITGFRVTEVTGQRFLTIDVLDPDKYLAQCTSLARMMNVASAKMTGSPVNISASTLKVSLDELERLLSDAARKYGADESVEA
jgi:hypothetical protein